MRHFSTSVSARLLAALFLAALPAGAPARGLGGEATAARADHKWGGELGLGYGVDIGPLRLRALGGAFLFRGDNDRYYRDRFSNGQERCRDSETGYFAKDSECTNLGSKGYAKIEAAFQPFGGVEIGGGGRYMSDSLRPYGFIAAPIAPRIRAIGTAGDRYVALGLRAGF